MITNSADDYPIVVLSFNRPHYLESVLRSLRDQSTPVKSSRVILFQDGYRSKSGHDLTDPRLIDRCVELFKEIFPEGRIVTGPENVGVAWNFARAERFVFTDLGAEAAYFFEDDLVLSNQYLDVLGMLTEIALSDRRIAYVAAYGDHRATLSEQRLSPTRLMLMRHKWGFATTRRQWERQQDLLQPYLEIVNRADYSQRDDRAIRDYFRTLGYGSTGTSQDAMKDVASCVLGTTKIMTFACFAKYVGEIGIHSNKQSFQEDGFSNTDLYPDIITSLARPADEQIEDWISYTRRNGNRALAEEHPTPTAALRLNDLSENSEGDGLMQSNISQQEAQEAHQDDLVAKAGRYANAIYRSLLLREPDAHGLASTIKQLQGGRTLPDLVEWCARSEEFASKQTEFLTAHEPAVLRPGGAHLAPSPAGPFDEPSAVVTSSDLRLALQIRSLRAARASGKIKIVLGAAGTSYPEWVSTDKELLHLLHPETWLAWLDEGSIDAMVAEHVWEHLDQSEGIEAARTCWRFLKPSGHLRIAVPDGFKPDDEYQRVSGVGGPHHHKMSYNYRSLSEFLRKTGFTVKLLEYWDEDGRFHQDLWSSDDGHISRSANFDRRNKEEPLRFTSLIVDAFRGAEETSEYRLRYSPHVVAEACYFGILDRAPDPKGFANTVAALLSRNEHLDTVVTAIKNSLKSEEYKEKTTRHFATRFLNAPMVSGHSPIRHVVSLGSHCIVSQTLKELGLKRYSCPFDWIFSSIPMVQHCLSDRCSTLAARDFFAPIIEADGSESVGRCGHRHYLEKFEVKSIFNHRDMRVPENYAYLKKCIERFEAVLRSSDRKLFLVVSRDATEQEFASLFATLSSVTTNFDLLIVRVMQPKVNRLDFGLGEVAKIERSRLLEMRPLSKMGPLSFEHAYDDIILRRAILNFGVVGEDLVDIIIAP